MSEVRQCDGFFKGEGDVGHGCSLTAVQNRGDAVRTVCILVRLDRAGNLADGAAANDVIRLDTRRAVAVGFQQVAFLHRDACIDAADERTDRRDIHIVGRSPIVVPRHEHAVDLLAASGVANLGFR